MDDSKQIYGEDIRANYECSIMEEEIWTFLKDKNSNLKLYLSKKANFERISFFSHSNHILEPSKYHPINSMRPKGGKFS